MFMILNNKKTKHTIFISAIILSIAGCQKMDRPELGELLLDPPPPPYSDLKSLWSFEDNLTDEGENKLNATSNNVSYVDGVNGKAVKIGDGGYVLLKAIGDTVVYPNEFKAVPADTLTNLGSFTLSFWMNGVGPVPNAQGLFSISNKNEFWGNLDLFLESDAVADEAFLKVHMFNAGVTSGNGEEWNEVKIPGALNKWTHIAITYDAATSIFNLYADGVAVIADKTLGGGTYGQVKFKDFNGMVLGNHQFQTNPSLTNHGPESWARAFNGAFDQFRLYNRALSASEIQGLVDSMD